MIRDLAQLAGGGVVALVIGEGLLRVAGPGVWARFDGFDDVPAISEPDPERGWRNRPGHYAFALGDRTIDVTVDALGRRGEVTDDRVGLFGGSYVYGYGLSDGEVAGAGWANHAVPGYGTLQSVLTYEALEAPPAVVVYGLVDLHDGRNAAVLSWRYALERSGRGHAWGAVPGAWWDGETLHYTAPRGYAHWPVSEHLAWAHLVERAQLGLRDRFARTKSETTIQLVKRFAEAVQADGGRFAVALLHAPDRERFYARRLDEEGIAWLDLRHPRFPEWSIPGDGHPDARVHRDWDAKLREAL